MLISFEHEFIFIHPYRTGGTSIEKALAPYSHDPGRTLSVRLKRKFNLPFEIPYRSYKYRQFYKHIRAKDLKKALPASIYDRFFKFAIVRNPWEVQVSLYHYILSNSSHTFYNDVAALNGFEEFVEWIPKNYFRLQMDFVVDDDGRQIVDYVGRFENLDSEFKAICGKLSLDVDLVHENASRHEDYRKYYANGSIEAVGRIFRPDIEYFHYTFE